MSTFVSTVNSGAAYVVNDIYRRYVDPDGAARGGYVVLGYIASVAVILLGIAFGFATTASTRSPSGSSRALVPAFVAPNVLKWHWWRFNRWGFFAGMVAGTAASLVLPLLVPGLHDVTQFMSILGGSAVLSLVVCLATPADDRRAEDASTAASGRGGSGVRSTGNSAPRTPTFERNRDFGRDVFNLAVSLVWQTAMVALPIYLVIQQWSKTLVCLGVFAVTSVILKFTWYDRLGPGEMYLEEPAADPAGPSG